MKCRNIGLAKLLSHISLVSLLWVTSHAAIAAELEWIGAIDNDVTNGANWSGGVAPGGTDRANFRNGESTNPTPNVGANNVTWDQLRFNNIGPTTINGTGTITLNNLNSNGNGQAAVYSEGGNVGPSIINPNIVTTGVVQTNGQHNVTFNGTVTAGRIEAFGGATGTYNGNVTVTDEFIFGNAVAVFNGDYRRNVCEGCGVGMGITNSGSDITFTTFSSNDPNHPNGVDILNLYNGHTIRNGQDNTFNDTKPWSRNGTANIYSLNGFDDSVEFFGTDGGSSMAIQFGAASGANSLVWETPNFMNGGTYPVTQFENGLDSLQLGTTTPFDAAQLGAIKVNGLSYSATDPLNSGQYWNLNANKFVEIHQSVPEPST